ncbi:MAG: polyhydroxyalkanoate synthesis repressor PhaR [Gammaproteobacteria bacterium]|nr:polyhydroxyalkanoate synthesis repressor PhaR [Gammaproteobacteria bacterium]MCW5582850.1 polyhydroxyalkanoate synthesis repressor PhaR [Gammaproteobacteria bacterium]
MQPVRIIKKYPNRRLYDTKLGVYITLDEVKKLVLDRIAFQVIDVRTKKDLTQNTLLQIITEQETTSTPIFTNALLQDFIRSYHEKSHHIFTGYLEQVMNLFLHQKELLKNQWSLYQKLLANPALIQQIPQMQKLTTTPTSSPQKKQSSHPKKRLKNRNK